MRAESPPATVRRADAGPRSPALILQDSQPAPEPVHLSLLGGFAVRRGADTIAMSASAQRVLAFVALHGSACLRRSFVAGSIWPDATERHATGNLRTALWRLRRLGIPILDVPSAAAALATDHRDAVAFARRLLDPSIAMEEGELHEDLLLLDLLADWPDEWLVVERERFRQLRLHALEALCERLTAAGHHGRAIQAALASVAGEPLRESAHRALIRAHFAEGNMAEALQQYRSCRRLLHDELGVEPSPQLQALIGTSISAQQRLPLR
jgi:DNA-binding SARP family transcriptional activator